jgi:hypothetical protein
MIFGKDRELTSRFRDESNVPNAFHFSRRSRKRYSAETVPQPVTAISIDRAIEQARQRLRPASTAQVCNAEFRP